MIDISSNTSVKQVDLKKSNIIAKEKC